MFDWIAANAGTLLVSAVLLVLVILAVLKMVRDRKQGKSTCSMGCEWIKETGNPATCFTPCRL